MSNDTTINFLVENGWEFNKNTGKAWHWKYSGEKEMSIDESMKVQEHFDPESVREHKMVNNLNSKYAHMYNEYLDS